jgi:Flp pilus assembly protein TadD
MHAEIDSIEADQRRFRNRLVALALGLVLLTVAGWFGRSAYHHFKEKREQALAQAFLARGDYRNALLSARQTLLLNPTNLPACRVMAELADRAHSPETTNLLLRIVQNEPTIENQLHLASAGLRYQNRPFPLTAQILEELPPAATNLASYQVLAASLDLSLGRLPEAEAHFETAAALEPTNRRFALNLATLRLSMNNETKAATARQVLEQLRTDTNFAPAALRALVVDRLARKDLAAANEYSTQLLAGTQATLGDRLQQLEILQRLHDGDLAPRLQAVQAASATNAPAVAQVAAWMQANGLLAESIPWLTNLPAEMRARYPVRIALADSYAQSADWRALRDFTSQGNWGDAEFLRLAILSHAWLQLDVKAAADSSWNSAVTEAGSRYRPLTTLLERAEKWKLPDKREDLLERIVMRFPEESWAQKALAGAYFSTGKTAELHALYARLFARFPQELEFENNLAATSLLLNTNLPQACRWAQEAYAGRTNDPDFATTYAFALHRQGRTSEGLAVLRKLAEPLRQGPDVALYYGCLLASTGATNEAAPYLENARTRGHLLPEEQKLLTDALGK